MMRMARRVLENKRRQQRVVVSHKRKIIAHKRKIAFEIKPKLRENKREFYIHSVKNKVKLRQKFVEARDKCRAQQRRQQLEHRKNIREHKLRIMQIKRER